MEGNQREKLEQQLQEARDNLLSLEYNWDDRGAKKIEEATFQRMVEFLFDLLENIQQEGIKWELPEIYPGTKGEVLVQWKTDRFQLVIVIPEDTLEPAIYYATDYDKNEDEGTASNERLNSLYINWARQF
ncbi:MAG TPA: hypothetical protein VKK79_15560 [Candidatus Lokiarchaeia archaeon]|nr:hypothetical protein [Candidatus Lokiarchaeia archaeon]